MSTTTATQISLGLPGPMQLGCQLDSCWEISRPLLRQLVDGRYDLMSVLTCPPSVDRWRDENRTARKRANRAFGRGYRANALTGTGGEDWDMINQSAPSRQGRPMSAGYRALTPWSPLPDYPCPRHATRVTGVMSGHDLRTVAYLVMIRAGELALVSQILGHADHLENEVMYLLFQYALEREIAADPECLVVYGRHDSGTDGLRFFKERLGFEERAVEWCP